MFVKNYKINGYVVQTAVIETYTNDKNYYVLH